MITVDIGGLAELEHRWEEAVRDIDVGIEHGVRDAVSEGAAEARNTHRFTNRTGTLEASIVGRVTRASVGSAAGEIDAGADYASFVENGTVRHPAPDGFMGRAYLKAEAVAIREIEIGVAEAKAVMER